MTKTMKRPQWIALWAEDPFDRRFLGGIGFPYDAKECSRGKYHWDVQTMKMLANKTIKAARTPKIRFKFIYEQSFDWNLLRYSPRGPQQ